MVHQALCMVKDNENHTFPSGHGNIYSDSTSNDLRPHSKCNPLPLLLAASPNCEARFLTMGGFFEVRVLKVRTPNFLYSDTLVLCPVSASDLFVEIRTDNIK